MKTKEEVIKERETMPILGHGKFEFVGKTYILPIVKIGKRDITMRSDDCGLITLNKKFVEETP